MGNGNDKMTQYQVEALQTVRGLTLQLMLISAGVFGIVGGFVSTTADSELQCGGALLWALICFAISTVAGYVVHGTVVSLLSHNKFNPNDRIIRWAGLAQLILFLTGGGLFVWFLAMNL